MIAAVLITKNEAKQIERALASVAWCDEIIVVDAQSSDQTPLICQSTDKSWSGKLRFFSRPWSGFKDQRNFALDQTTQPWVFVLDADEACSPELKNSIQSVVHAHQKDPSSCRYFKVRRQEYFLGKPIQKGIWNPSYQDRLFWKDGVQYVNDIHEYPKYPSPPQSIHEPILHDPDFGPTRFLDKMNKYTGIEALDRYKQGQRTSVFKLLFAFPAMFYKNYFYYSAYQDGVHGFVISLLEGVSRVVRHIKMFEIQLTELKKNGRA